MTAHAVDERELQLRRPFVLPGWVPRAAVWVPVAAAALWVLVLARNTSAGPAIREPGEFVVTLLDGVTFAGLLFVVASGFTLVFGLMRTVNMAHGSLFLGAAYVAHEIQTNMVGKDANIDARDVSLLAWILPLLAAGAVVALLGLLMQQLLLRWNQGQDLRQALITLAISVIAADQLLAHFGGVAQPLKWPGAVTHFFEIVGERYATSRLFMLGVALLVGGLLWLWLNRTRMGMVIRGLPGGRSRLVRRRVAPGSRRLRPPERLHRHRHRLSPGCPRLTRGPLPGIGSVWPPIGRILLPIRERVGALPELAAFGPL